MKKSLIALSLMAIAALASCNTATESSSSQASSQASSTQSSSSSSSSSSQTGEVITQDDLTKGVTTYTDAKGQTKNLTRSAIYKASGSPHVDSHPDSGTKQKLLVAPIAFKSDSTDSNYIQPTSELLGKIDKTFTATDEEMEQLSGAKLNSVQSFYQQSSFNKGAFDVVVLPCWITYADDNGNALTAKDFQKNAGSGAGVSMSSYVHSWYKKEYAKENHGSLGADWEYKWSDFDTDNDGYIDLIWQVYAYNYSSTDTSFWWAYVTYTGNKSNLSDPEIMTLAWASTKFMDSYNGYDPHTFIHETGHTLGINDFYDYQNTWKPMGSIDYMDQNLGDHSAYTKFCYGWINPYILKESDLEGGKTAEITLRAGTTSGDALVLASPNYNGTAYDEYLMVELMGPYGLAERDYLSGYSNTSGYTTPGIRITHVDARMHQNNHDTYVSDPNLLGRNGGDNRVCNTYGGRSGVKTDSDFWCEEITTEKAPADISKDNPNAKVGTIAKLDNGNRNAYYTEISLMQTTASKEDNWTLSANYAATSDNTLFTKGNRFNLASSTGKASAWASRFMPSGSNLWNKAKSILGWKNSTTQYYEIDETMKCNFNLRVTDISTDDTYGAAAKLTITLNA